MDCRYVCVCKNCRYENIINCRHDYIYTTIIVVYQLKIIRDETLFPSSSGYATIVDICEYVANYVIKSNCRRVCIHATILDICLCITN